MTVCLSDESASPLFASRGCDTVLLVAAADC